MSDGEVTPPDPSVDPAAKAPPEAEDAGQPRAARRGARLGRFAPYALIALLYLATSPYHQGLNNPNEMVRVYMTKALVDEGSPVIDRVVRAWGGVDDKAIRDGKLYSSKAPLQSLLGVPAYAIAEPLLGAFGVAATKRTITTVLRVFASVIPTMIFAWILLAWARRRALELDAPVGAGTGVGLAIALGTMLYPYALTFTGHALAAFAAGGCYLAIVQMSRKTPGSPRWRHLALLAGLGAGAAPFAEYPSVLVAIPALVAAFVITPTNRLRAELLLWLTAGGAAPFVLGLWAHHDSWGSPFRTGYAFLENTAYSELHGHGFFGVSLPKAEAFAGALFSPGTGLFFYSPILIVGLAALVLGALRRPERDGGEAEHEPSSEASEGSRTPAGAPIARALAIAGLVGFVAEVLFISAHGGWRGGWTVGPRYIIPVAPLLAVWVVEALAAPRVRGFIAALGAVSIVTTGFAAALYPHLSDVFTNPLKTFLWPSYLRGETTYGIGHALGLTGGAANLVHVVPLVVAIVWVAARGASFDGGWRRRAVIVVGTSVAMLGIVAVIPERDAGAAERENQRLWGFWEPARPRDGAGTPVATTARPRPPNLVWDARTRWREVTVEVITADGARRRCTKEATRCRYGDQPWQYFGPESLDLGGARTPVLFMHPIAGATVRAEIPIRAGVRRAIVRYGLTDASIGSGNTEPVHLALSHGATELRRVEVRNVPGLHEVELTLGSTTAPLSIDLTAKNDGARVFGLDVELYRP